MEEELRAAECGGGDLGLYPHPESPGNGAPGT